jgi:hypothetical protein
VCGGVPDPSVGDRCTTLDVGLFPSSPWCQLLECCLRFLCFGDSPMAAVVPVLPSVVAVEAFCSSALTSVLGAGGLLRVMASPVFADAAAVDAHSMSEVCRGVSMTSNLAAFPMRGAACGSWLVEFVPASSFGVSSGLLGGGVLRWCLKSLVGCVMYFR